MTPSGWIKAGLSGLSLLVLAGCFGGSSSDSPGANPPGMSGPTLPPDPLTSLPSSVTASISSVLSYQFALLQVPAERADRAEPLDLADVSLPVSDTTEPADV